MGLEEQKEKEKRTLFGLNIGSSSVLVVFVVLCLISFAALSTVSALADYTLSKKMAEGSAGYYNACNQAALDLAALDKTLQEAYANAADETAYFAATTDAITYSYSVSDTQMLEVEVKICYPKADTDTFYEIVRWQTLTKE